MCLSGSGVAQPLPTTYKLVCVSIKASSGALEMDEVSTRYLPNLPKDVKDKSRGFW